MPFVNIAILTLLLVLALVVLVKKEKKITDYFLMAIILAIASYIASDIWIHQVLNRDSFAFHSIAGYLPFPPILFYGMLLISKTHRIQSSWWWLVSFPVVYYLFIIGDLYLWNDYDQFDIEKLYVAPPWTYHFFYKGLHLYIIVAMLWFQGKLKAYQSDIQDYYSNLEKVDLSWFRYFVWVYIAVYSTSLSAMLALNFDILENIETAFLFIAISILLSLLWMIYHGLRQYTLANFSEAEAPVSQPKKYATSSLTSEDAEAFYQRIEELFEKEKIYRNPDLKVQYLASRLGVTNHNISQALNETAGKSFYDYVNDYRLRDFQKLLADPGKKHFTILALGMESGFNSKASINRIFKKQLGETPREYQQRMLT